MWLSRDPLDGVAKGLGIIQPPKTKWVSGGRRRRSIPRRGEEDLTIVCCPDDQLLLVPAADPSTIGQSCRIAEEESDVYKHRFIENQAS